MAWDDIFNKETGIMIGAGTGFLTGLCYFGEKVRNFVFGNPLEEAVNSMQSDMAEIKDTLKTIAGEKAVKEAKKEAAQPAKEEKTSEPNKAQ